MQGIFAGRTQLRYPYGRYGYTRGGGKIWHGGMDLVARVAAGCGGTEREIGPQSGKI